MGRFIESAINRDWFYVLSDHYFLLGSSFIKFIVLCTSFLSWGDCLASSLLLWVSLDSGNILCYFPASRFHKEVKLSTNACWQREATICWPQGAVLVVTESCSWSWIGELIVCITHSKVQSTVSLGEVQLSVLQSYREDMELNESKQRSVYWQRGITS